MEGMFRWKSFDFNPFIEKYKPNLGIEDTEPFNLFPTQSVVFTEDDSFKGLGGFTITISPNDDAMFE
jgi:hypothetical protein